MRCRPRRRWWGAASNAWWCLQYRGVRGLCRGARPGRRLAGHRRDRAGAQAACAATTSGRIAVIGTEATVRGGAYPRAILQRRPDAKVQQLPTQLLVALAEEGLVEGPVARSVVAHYLEPLFAQDPPDTLVLGCTHFPVLAPTIREVVGPAVSWSTPR